MNLFVTLVFAAYLGIVCGRPDDHYPTNYDNIDIDAIIKNDRLLKNYVNCLLERGRCNRDGSELKRYLPDAIQSNCSKCSEAQKTGSKKIIHHLIDNKRDWWNELEVKYDPEGKYRKQYDQEIKKEGLDI